MKKRKFRAYFKTLIMTLYCKFNNFFYKRCFPVRQTLLLKNVICDSENHCQKLTAIFYSRADTGFRLKS